MRGSRIDMATSEMWHRRVTEAQEREITRSRGMQKGYAEQALWMFADVATILVASAVATYVRFRIMPLDQARDIWTDALWNTSKSLLLAMLAFFALALILISRRSHLYEPMRISTVLQEQWLSLESCLTSGLLLTGALYLVRAYRVPRSVVLMTVLMAVP